MIRHSIITLLFIAGFALTSSAQHQTSQILKGERADTYAPGSELVRLKPFSDVPNYLRFRQGKAIPEAKAFPYLSRFIAQGKGKSGFQLINMNNGSMKMTHKRYVQTINNIPLEYSAYLLHSDNGMVKSMNGNICSDPEISGNFQLSKAEALAAAETHIGADVYIYDEGAESPYRGEFSEPKPEKVYFPDKGNLYSNAFRAAYKIDVFALYPYSRHWVYVDAQTGEVLDKETRIHTTDVPGTAVTAYSGTQSIVTDSYNGYYRLRESGRGNGIETYNCQDDASYQNAVDFTDDDNHWDNVNADLDEYATDAHFATEQTYDYFYNEHGRNSIDGYGLKLESYVHFSLIDYDYPSNVNAFWNGSVMTYGDGSDTYTPLTTVDIAAHEITHGLTSYTCNLVYQDESGALNESFSDIFGATVEFYAVPSYADWYIGEDIGSPFRSLADPKAYGNPDTYQGEYWVTDGSDNGGVHTNMGALCYWYYMLCEGDSGTNDNGDSYAVSPIGMASAEDIAFRLQTVYLTNTSEYADARFYGIQAAVDLFGSCSTEVEAVTDAFYGIGVGPAYIPTVQADFTATYTEGCETPFTVNFQNLSINGTSFVWDFGDGNTSTEVNPSHTYTSFGDFDVKLYANGGDCGEDSITKTGFVSVDPSNPCITLMPESGSETSEACNGSLYDAGGPAEPYLDQTDATFTIAPAGATEITMNISEFDIEPGSGSTCDFDYIAFYDGNSTSAPLINGTYYCNTTGNPGTITSSGGAITIEFHSDQAVAHDGFQIDWECIQEEAPPVAAFSADGLFCTGRLQFMDESSNLPTSWTWDFGDGNTSNEQHPEHVYHTAGTYTVSLSVSNAYGSDNITNTLTIGLGPAPSVENQTVCMDSAFTLDIDGYGDNLNWYNDADCFDLAHSGALWEHPAISSSTNYYLREMIPSPDDTTGASNNTAGGGFFGNVDYVHYLIFDAYHSFTLKSVNVHADGAGTRSIALRDQNQNIIETTDVYIQDGVSRIDLNFDVPVGENLQLVGLGAPDLYRTSDASYLNYPYTIDGVLSIKYSSASTTPSTPYEYYYYFYDWIVTTPFCESETAVMDIDVEDCTVGKIMNPLSDRLSMHPNPGKGTFYLSGIKSKDYPLNIRITDSRGKAVIQKSVTSNKIDLHKLSSGMYFMRVNTATDTHVIKFVVK